MLVLSSEKRQREKIVRTSTNSAVNFHKNQLSRKIINTYIYISIGESTDTSIYMQYQQ